MARKSLSRATAEALGPIVVPLVTKVALPIAIESLRRGGRFDTDRFYAEAKESLAKGFQKSKPELEDLKDELSERGRVSTPRRASTAPICSRPSPRRAPRSPRTGWGVPARAAAPASARCSSFWPSSASSPRW